MTRRPSTFVVEPQAGVGFAVSSSVRAAVVVIGLAACSYSPPDTTNDQMPTDATGDGGVDAADPDVALSCTPGASTCSGRTLQTCNATGDAFTQTACPLTCDVDHCTQASNVDAAIQAACVDTAPAFVADATSSGIAITGANNTLACSNCNSIDPTRVEVGAIDLLVYCLSRFELPLNRTLSVQPGDAAIVLFVAGDVQLDGAIELRGASDANDGNLNTPPGGAGGFAGGTTANSNKGPGGPGGGNCGGGGGASTAGTSNVGGGGGGGGYASIAAAGGIGHEANNTPAAAGTAGALCTSSPKELVPLIGGSGGGAGGDGACSSTLCGRPGGGGGGAIQISATGTIVIGATGSILASGGAGGFITSANNTRGGGGGGGAGGAILLEAPTLILQGALDVRGGAGGASDLTLGGVGATPFIAPGAGTEGGLDRGGGGGGGAVGRIRLNATTGATCPGATATDPCTAGTLRVAPIAARR